MVKEESNRSEEQIEASGDAIVIADAIYGGLAEIAGAIRELAKAQAGEDYGDAEESDTYLDGSRK